MYPLLEHCQSLLTSGTPVSRYFAARSDGRSRRCDQLTLRLGWSYPRPQTIHILMVGIFNIDHTFVDGRQVNFSYTHMDL